MNFQPKNRPRSIYTDQSVYIEQKKGRWAYGGIRTIGRSAAKGDKTLHIK